jgi:hypothetical protein
VDFFATRPGEPLLETASAAHPGAVALLVTQDQSPPTRSLPGTLPWYSAAQWLLG